MLFAEFLIAAAHPDDVQAEYKVFGVLFWSVVFLASMAKCRTLAKRPRTNAATCNGLAIVLFSFLGFIVMGWLSSQFDFGNLFPLMSLGVFGLTLVGAILAARGLVEIKRDDEGRYNQGFKQGVTAILLAALPSMAVGYGVYEGFREQLAKISRKKDDVATSPRKSVYPFDEFQFQVSKLPEAWAPTNPKKLNNLACAAFLRTDTETYMMMVAEPNDANTHLESAVQNVKTHLETTGPLAPIVESDRRIDGLDGRELRFQRKHNGLTLDYVSWVGVGQKYCYQMVIWKRKEGKGSLDAELNTFIQALTFTEVAKPDLQLAEAEDTNQAGVSLPPEKALPPFALKSPPPPARMYGDMDLSAMEPDELYRNADKLYRSGKYTQAAHFQHWYYQKTKSGLYTLACFFGCANEVETSIFFLQETGLHEGCDPEWAAADNDLQFVHADPRWPKLKLFLDSCATYWRKSVKPQVPVVYPKSYKPGTPTSVMVGLHGLGDSSNNFVGDHYQELADELGIVIVGVSGTHANGPTSFSWSEHTQHDARHVLNALASVDKLNIKKGRIGLFGFSQGAQMSFEIAAKYPAQFCGAIALSPGSQSRRGILRMKAVDENKNQHFIFIAGAGEHPSTVRAARHGNEWAEKSHAKSQLLIYEKQRTHAFPSDFNERIAPWIREVLQLPNPK